MTRTRLYQRRTKMWSLSIKGAIGAARAEIGRFEIGRPERSPRTWSEYIFSLDIMHVDSCVLGDER